MTPFSPTRKIEMEPIPSTEIDPILTVVSAETLEALDHTVCEIAIEQIKNIGVIFQTLMDPENGMSDRVRISGLEKMDMLRMQLQIKAGTPGLVTFLDPKRVQYLNPEFRLPLQRKILTILTDVLHENGIENVGSKRIQSVPLKNRHITLLHSRQTQNGGAYNITAENEVSLIQTYNCLKAEPLSPPEGWSTTASPRITLFGSQPTPSKPGFLMVVVTLFHLEAEDPYLEKIKMKRQEFANFGFEVPEDIIDVYGNTQKLNDIFSAHDTLFHIPDVPYSELETWKKGVEIANAFFQGWKTKNGLTEFRIDSQTFEPPQITFIAVEGNQNPYHLVDLTQYFQNFAKEVQDKFFIHLEELKSQVALKAS